MKNKKFLKWMHRLPVLLLTLILAVVPFTMAAPAHADVLSGVSDYYFTVSAGDGFQVKFPLPSGFDFPYFAMFDCSSNGDGLVLIGSYERAFVRRFTYSNYDIIEYSTNVVSQPKLTCYIYYFTETGFDESSGTMLGYWSSPVVDSGGYIFDPASLVDFIFGGGNIELRDVEDLSLMGTVTTVSSAGVLSVFSGVGSWLSRAVLNISTMFWTAESGMSVLGYLAVASLALAVILLIFYLIAGWLKFH